MGVEVTANCYVDSAAASMLLRCAGVHILDKHLTYLMQGTNLLHRAVQALYRRI